MVNERSIRSIYREIKASGKVYTCTRRTEGREELYALVDKKGLLHQWTKQGGWSLADVTCYNNPRNWGFVEWSLPILYGTLAEFELEHGDIL